MQLKKMLPWTTLVLGLLCGLLRGLDLARGYDQVTGLPTGALWEPVLIVCLAAACVVLFLLARSYPGSSPKEKAFETYFTGAGDLYKTVSVLCAAVLALSGAAGLYFTLTGANTPKQSEVAVLAGTVNPLFDLIAQIPLWILAIVTAVVFIRMAGVAARGFISEEQAGLTIVPVFWSAFDLILTFKDNSGTPMLGHYVFELLAAGLLTLSFYYYAGFLFAKPHPARFAFCASMASCLALTSAVGVGVAVLLGVDYLPGALLRQACFVAAAAWLLSQLVLMAKGRAPSDAAPAQPAQG